MPNPSSPPSSLTHPQLSGKCRAPPPRQSAAAPECNQTARPLHGGKQEGRVALGSAPQEGRRRKAVEGGWSAGSRKSGRKVLAVMSRPGKGKGAKPGIDSEGAVRLDPCCLLPAKSISTPLSSIARNKKEQGRDKEQGAEEVDPKTLPGHSQASMLSLSPLGKQTWVP